jgi:broad specificity phosphatase PhoE
MGTLLFTRHGETEDNLAQRLSTAPPGPPLTELGCRQAAELAAALAERQLEAIYTSPLVRARQTAEIVGGDRGIPIHLVDALRELSVGAREGRTDPGVFEEMDQVWKTWTVDGDLELEAGPGGETGQQVLARGLAALKVIRRAHPSGTVLVVAHSGILQLLVPHFCANLAKDHGVRNWCRNCQLIEVEVEASAARCVAWAGQLV